MSSSNIKLFNFFYLGGFGICLVAGPDLMFGAKGFVPYMLETASVVSEFFGRSFGTQLLAMAAPFMLDKDNWDLRPTTIAHALILPIMAHCAFSGNAAFNATIWKGQLVIHSIVTYLTYNASFGATDGKKKK